MEERWPSCHGLPSWREHCLLLNTVAIYKSGENLPESVHRRSSLLVLLLAGRRSAGTAAGRAVLTATDQVATGA